MLIDVTIRFLYYLLSRPTIISWSKTETKRKENRTASKLRRQIFTTDIHAIFQRFCRRPFIFFIFFFCLFVSGLLVIPPRVRREIFLFPNFVSLSDPACCISGHFANRDGTHVKTESVPAKLGRLIGLF